MMLHPDLLFPVARNASELTLIFKLREVRREWRDAIDKADKASREWQDLLVAFNVRWSGALLRMRRLPRGVRFGVRVPAPHA